MQQLMQAYNQCEEIIKEHSKTFYRSFSLLPKEGKRATYAIYAFCRFVDDIVDEGENVEAELHAFEEEFQRYIVNKEETTHFMWLALQHSFSTFSLETQPFLDMITGQKMDLTLHRYETMEEVFTYSYHVASTVGLMLLPILAPKNEQTLKEDAIALGKGMQITNILRDVHEDYKRGRIYLPEELMIKHGYTENMLAQKIVNHSFISLWEEMASIAESYYEQFMSSLHYYPLSSRLPLKGAAILYREILNEIRRKEYQVFEMKHYVSDENKEQLLQKLKN